MAKNHKTKYMIACKNNKGKFKHFSVPEEVWLYIRQLECYIKQPQISKFKEKYPERFRNDLS